MMSIIRSNIRNLFVDDPTVEFGNSFGHIALWTMSFFLLSVSRQTPLLPSGIHAFHIWPGRIIVVCTVFHGMVHMYRWQVQVGASVVAMVMPPMECWRRRASNTTTENDDSNCLDPVTGCSCYAKFRNLTGFCAACGMILIGVTSLYKVRRRWFRIFYLIHISVAPLTMLLLCLHFTRSLIYMAPSVLYYIATSFPVLLEQARKSRTGVRIQSSRRISRKCSLLTVQASEEAMALYQPGHHVLLRVPSISRLSHPFTVNRVLGKSHLLCILFNPTGSFTTSLANALLCKDDAPLPCIDMCGYHCSGNLIEDALRYDTVVLICGGIGIVAYLSLLQDLLSEKQQVPEIRLYWACRDAHLIQFIQQNYLDPLTIQEVSEGLLKITIYQTSTNEASSSSTCTMDAEEKTGASLTRDDSGEPFSTSRISNSQRGFGKRGTRLVYGMNLLFGSFVSWYVCTNALNEEDVAATVWMYVCLVGIIVYVALIAKRKESRYLARFSLVVWSGLFIIWYCYLNKQDEFSRILSRLWSPIAVVLLGMIVAVISVCQTTDLNTVHYAPVDQKSNDDGVELSECASRDGSTSIAGGETIRIAMEHGRPNIPSLLQSLVSKKKSVGIFACGPASLMEDVRSAVRGIKLRHVCGARAGPKQVDLYEESFEK